jgi:hypothetical protein
MLGYAIIVLVCVVGLVWLGRRFIRRTLDR